MDEFTLILDTPISKETFEETINKKSKEAIILCSGTLNNGEKVTGHIYFTGTGKVSDRGWSGYFSQKDGIDFYASSNKWEDGYCKIIDLLD